MTKKLAEICAIIVQCRFVKVYTIFIDHPSVGPYKWDEVGESGT